MIDKEEQVFTRIRKAEKDELLRIARILDVPTSYIVRDALREKVESIKRTNPKVRNELALQN